MERAPGAELTAEEAQALDRAGTLVLSQTLSSATCEHLRRLLEEALAEAGAPWSAGATGTRHVAALATRDPAFEVVLAHPVLLAAARHVLGRPFRLLQLAGREPLRGFGQQGLHTDMPPRVPGEPWSVVTALFLLDDYTAANGATRVVPGSHHAVGPLPRSLSAPDRHHPDEVLVQARAGDALILNGHVLHGGTRNTSGERRRVLQVQLVAADRLPPTHPVPDAPSWLSATAARLLGIAERRGGER